MFQDRSLEALLEIERRLRASLFERVEASSSPGGLTLTFDPHTEMLHGCQTRATMQAFGQGAVIDIEIRVSLSRGKVVTWLKIFPKPEKLPENLLFLDPVVPKSFGIAVGYLLDSFYETLMPIKPPKRRRASRP